MNETHDPNRTVEGGEQRLDGIGFEGYAEQIGFDTGVSEHRTCIPVASTISFVRTLMQRFRVTTMPATGF
jgi:hypothetical protein